jgi:HSP20 family protein
MMTRPHDWTRDFFAAPLNQIQDELHRVLGGLRGRVYVGPVSDAAKDEPTDWTPDVDVVAGADAFSVLVDLPGVELNAVDVSISGTALTIRGYRAPATESDDRSRAGERPYGRFARRIELPSDVDPDAVEARLNLGVLTISLPKVPAARPKTVPVRQA